MRCSANRFMRTLACLGAVYCGAAQGAFAGSPLGIVQSFADNCFSPFLTAAKAETALRTPGVRVDFYDLDPFSSVLPSPVVGRPATPGTDRRCEIAFDGDHRAIAVKAAVEALKSEGIVSEADLPQTHTKTGGTALLAARQLNPKRIAVVHVGTRPGPSGPETFMTVERLIPATQ